MVKINLERELIPFDIKESLDSVAEKFICKVRAKGANVNNVELRYARDDHNYIVRLSFAFLKGNKTYTAEGYLYVDETVCGMPS